ncbi:hypothetical protein RIF29_19414 [Crotalaria pallida]|uniref:Uncharacterized protein n=1 Tax=Crotalaria pallida TaxID=3830 RepID=A0AAN9F3S5_CROPI
MDSFATHSGFSQELGAWTSVEAVLKGGPLTAAINGCADRFNSLVAQVQICHVSMSVFAAPCLRCRPFWIRHHRTRSPPLMEMSGFRHQPGPVEKERQRQREGGE